MNAVEFLKELKRRSASRPDYYGEELSIAYINPEALAAQVEQWSKENPVKTRQSEFMKVFPNARVFIDGILDFCPQEIDKCYPCQSTDIEMRCQSCRRDYWLQEVE